MLYDEDFVNATSLSVSFLERTLHLTLRVALRHILTLVIELLADRKRQLQLHQTVLKVQLERYERIALLAHLADELINLLAV